MQLGSAGKSVPAITDVREVWVLLSSLWKKLSRVVALGVGPRKARYVFKIKSSKGLLSNEVQTVGSVLSKRSPDESRGAAELCAELIA